MITHHAEMGTDAEDALRRRRERGRRSQNRRLKTAIEKLVNTIRGDEHPELLTSIFDVANAAGIDAKTPAHSVTAQSKPNHVSGNHRILKSFVDSQEDITVNARTGNFMYHQHYMRVCIPPDDILPYLGKGAKTFAGIIFWSMMDHSQNKCTRRHTEVTALIQRGLRHSKVTESWAITYIQAMVEARQEYRLTGSISPEYASAAEPDLGTVVRDQIKAEYRAQGKDPDKWLSAMGIEKRIKSMVDDNTFATFETVARRRGDPFLQHLFEMTMCKLSETCICFGDGPRWSVDVVDKLFLSWIHETYGLLHRRD
ncbi:hypothetical protein F5Y05DRAFT_425179 [Hypoxylon sp. FL0543]|nr:hypothetical protein F5Y05DRAFT_425179 [Hypoxylon sp. FL0543]